MHLTPLHRYRTALGSVALVALLLIAAAALGVASGWGGAEAQRSERAVAITVGGEHACALLDSGAIECWGENSAGETDAPSGTFSAVSAGGDHTCGLRTGGAIECWGLNHVGQADAPGGAFSAVSAGGGHTCGLRTGGAIECWGLNHVGQADAPGGTFSAVSAGSSLACGLRTGGAVVCWGYTFDGQAQPPPGRHTAISSGRYHACALSEDGTVSCWMIYNGAADVPPWLREPAAATVGAPASGRIVARRLADGRTEFGWQPAGAEERVLPSQRYFPASGVAVGRWLRSSLIEVAGIEIGRINARLSEDSRIEFAFTPTDGERILPPSRYFPTSPTVDRWLRSTEIDLGGG